MKKSYVFFGLAILAVALHGIDKYGANADCYEIVQTDKILYGEILLDKCKGRTWTLVMSEENLEELGYIADAENETVNTLVWTRIERGGGVLSVSDSNE